MKVKEALRSTAGKLAGARGPFKDGLKGIPPEEILGQILGRAKEIEFIEALPMTTTAVLAVRSASAAFCTVLTVVVSLSVTLTEPVPVFTVISLEPLPTASTVPVSCWICTRCPVRPATGVPDA